MLLGKIQNFFAKTDLWILIRISPFIFAFHEFEEWNILSWHRKYQANIPDVIDLHLRTIFVIIVGLNFLFFIFVIRIRNRGMAAKILFPAFSFMLYNGFVHFYWSIYFQSYSPGLIFGFMFSVPLIGIIFYKMISEKLVKKWFVSIMGILLIAMFVNVIMIGNKLEPGIVNAMLLGKIITEWIGLN